MKNVTNKLKLLGILSMVFMLYSINGRSQISINPNNTPFSTYGAYTSIMTERGQAYIRDISGRRMWKNKRVFRIELLKDSVSVPYTVSANTMVLTLQSKEGHVDFFYESADVIRFKGKNVSLRFTQTAWDGSSIGFPVTNDSQVWRIQMGGFPHYAYTASVGKMKAFPTQTLIAINHIVHDRNKPQIIIIQQPNTNGDIEGAIEQYQVSWAIRDYKKSMNDCIKDNMESLQKFEADLPLCPKQFEDITKLAAYTKWSSVVMPRGFIDREVMLCSKNSMTAVWSWDNCFDAMSIYKRLDFALGNMTLQFAYQDPKGHIPDLINDQHALWGAVKPPIQGISLAKIEELQKKPLPIEQITKLYKPIANFTMYWFRYMDNNNNGIPEYYHGNDSGMDNGTAFEAGYPVESPDLCAYLILQCEYLAKMAGRLNLKKEQEEWIKRTEQLSKALYSQLWDGNKFIAINAISRKPHPDSHSFITYIPVILGNRLPKEIKEKLLASLKSENSIVTNFGPASEHIDSKFYVADGYWRGPIWAPNTFWLYEGLKSCGETAFAKKVALNYCEMCRKNGFAENFEATTGKALRDSGYSWTISVYLLLASELNK